MRISPNASLLAAAGELHCPLASGCAAGARRVQQAYELHGGASIITGMRVTRFAHGKRAHSEPTRATNGTVVVSFAQRTAGAHGRTPTKMPTEVGQEIYE